MQPEAGEKNYTEREREAAAAAKRVVMLLLAVHT
jgi:hypothetical protein